MLSLWVDTLNYPPSFLFLYLGRLVRSLVYLPPSFLFRYLERLVRSLVLFPAMDITPIPALGDNYMYLVVDTWTKEAAVVDPVEPEKCVAAAKQKNANITQVWTTHHHHDHAGGNDKISKLIPGIAIHGGDDRIQGLNRKVKDCDRLKLGGLEVTCMFTPCHTTGHICYFIEGGDGVTPAVFTGDCLFQGGCGRFFEGTASQMHTALNVKLANLPSDTQVYCGHEYTVKNLMYGLHVELNNTHIRERLEWARAQCGQGLPTVPSTIGGEKLFNVFMRTNEGNIRKRYGVTDVVEVMAALRKEKDHWRPS